jgi:hypothetical protein
MARKSTGRLTCEMCPSIDVRRWQREGRLRADQCFPYSWMHGGQSAGGISVRTEIDAVVLCFRFSPPEGSDWKSVEQRVPIVWTECHFGGSRPWFRCAATVNGEKCQRRAAKLYIGASPTFACRQCHGLVFASQLETVRFRGLGRARKIRMRLGAAPDLFGPFPEKPKKMHRKTYEHLRHIHDVALA